MPSVSPIQVTRWSIAGLGGKSSKKGVARHRSHLSVLRDTIQRFQILGDSSVPWMLALGTAVVAELVLHLLYTGRVPNLLSAYISGNSVAILLKPSGGLLWPFVVCSLLAIVSKYVLRYRGRHLWNRRTSASA